MFYQFDDTSTKVCPHKPARIKHAPRQPSELQATQSNVPFLLRKLEHIQQALVENPIMADNKIRKPGTNGSHGF